MVQQHFAKFLGKKIWNLKTEQTVLLTAVRADGIMFLNGKPAEQKGEFNDFKLLISDDDDIVKLDLPIDLALIPIQQVSVRRPVSYTPDIFLKTIKKIVYSTANLTDTIMHENRNSRKTVYRESRQVIMAAYFCAFENKGISQSEAASIYGKDHATCVNAINVCNNQIDTNPVFREKYSKVWNTVLLVNRKSRLHI